MTYKSILSKRYLVVVLAVVLLAVVYYYFAIFNSTQKISLHASFKGYNNAEALYNDAQLVVIGTPTEAFEKRKNNATFYNDGSLQDFYTLTNIKIEKIIKGPTDTPKSLDVIEPISLIQELSGKKKITFESYSELKLGSKYIIFLKKNTKGEYSVINMQNGKFNLDNTDIDDNKTDSVDNKNLFRKDIQDKYLK